MPPRPKRTVAGLLAHAALLSALCFPLGLSAQSGEYKWMKLWNGKDLEGWNYRPECFRVENGMIVAQGKVEGPTTYCATRQNFSDFELSIRARLFEKGLTYYTNTGIQYRSRLADDTKKILQGYQLDIGDNVAASMYPEGGYPAGQGMVSSSSACKAAMKTDEFNHYLIRAEGKKITHRLNGALCNEYVGTVEDGLVGVQLHSVYGPGSTANTVMRADFTDILIRPLNNSFEIPDSLAYFPPQSTRLAPTFNRAGSGGPALRIGQGRFIGRPGTLLSVYSLLGQALPIRAVESADRRMPGK